MSSSLLLLAAPKAEYIELPPAQLEKLSSDDFEERETAYKAIHEWADQNLTAAPELLYKAWRANEDPEVQSRCYHLMRQMVTQRKFGKGKGFLGYSNDRGYFACQAWRGLLVVEAVSGRKYSG